MADTPQSRAQRRLGASVIRRLKNCTLGFVGGQVSGVLVDTLDNPALGEMVMQARSIRVRVLKADTDALALAPKDGDSVQLASLLTGASSARKVQTVEHDRNTDTLTLVLKR